MLVALDTNVLAYAEGVERAPADGRKIVLSRILIEALDLSDNVLVVPVQALAELHSVLVRRARLSPRDASARARRLAAICQQAPTGAETFASAAGLAAEHGLQIYDAVVLAAAADAGCELLCSEDLHDRFLWRGLTVTNPFGPAPERRLARLLGR